VGIANEQTAVNYPMVGKNGGVQLLNIARMRTSDAYARALDTIASCRYNKWIGFLGDQTFYTYLAHDF